jgi:hypothetical protein
MTSLGNLTHLDRFIRNRNGKTIEEIAAEDGITQEAVRKSIRAVEFKKGFHTQEYLQEMLIGITLKSSPSVQNALLEALDASTKRTVKNDRGEDMTILEPDHDTRLKAVGEFRQIAAVAQPKPGHQTSVKVGVGVIGGVGQASGSFVGMEEVLRDIRQKRKEQPVLEGKTVQSVVLEASKSEIIDGDDDGDDDDDE